MNFEIILGKIRQYLKDSEATMFLVRRNDPHNSEYISPFWDEVSAICPFTGDNATVLITETSAFVSTDARYYIQCEKELEGSPFKLSKTIFQLIENKTIIVPPLITNVGFLRTLEKHGCQYIPGKSVFDILEIPRPEKPNSTVYRVPINVCGRSAEDKIKEILGSSTDYFVFSALDNIAWILNLRGSDIPYNSVFLSFLLLSKNEKILFTDCLLPSKNNIVTIKPYNDFYDYIYQLKNKYIHLDPLTSNLETFRCAKAHNTVIEEPEKAFAMKNIKNKKELAGFRKSHLADAVALIKALTFLHDFNYSWTEMSFEEKLEEIKKQNKDYIGPSFRTICAFADHGAIVHYESNKRTNCKIQGNSLLVLDCGSHYKYGTTDVTRTIAIGKPSSEQKKAYTYVLKGHISLLLESFPEDTTGQTLDSIARKELIKHNMNFQHSTGHGIGFNLCVHEGPAGISSRNIPVLPGTVLSDEPGYYKENCFGIRIENAVEVKTTKNKKLKLKSLTLCPYEKSLIIPSLLSAKEKIFINRYHATVREKLLPFITDTAEKKYLMKTTEAIQ